jgi:hypothetical protein
MHGEEKRQIDKLKAKNQSYPWWTLVEQRNAEFDPRMEDSLVSQRVAYFFRDAPA